MRCPKDNNDLIEIERQGIEIDYCPTCKGVWLDRRELDEIIARSTSPAGYDAPRRDDRDEVEYRDEPRRRSGGIMGRVGEMLDDDRDRSRHRRDRHDDDDRYDDDRYEDRDRYGKPRKRRKRDLLEDLFDF